MSKPQAGPRGVISPGEFYTLQELAGRMNVTVRLLREKYVLTGELHVAPIARGSEMVSYSEVARFIEARMG